jgi:hypothetical protein
MNDDHGWEEWPEEGHDLPDSDTGETGDEGFGPAGYEAELSDHEPTAEGYEPDTDAGPDADGGEAPAPLGYGDALVDDPTADADADADTGEPAPDTEPGEPAGTAGFGAADGAPVGADPDLDPHAEDTAWDTSPFPEPLDLGAPPEPVDGFPWTDPATLGHPDAALPDPAAAVSGTPDATDLFAYAGEDAPAGGGGWTALAASPDPATSALARFWAPGT